MRMPSLHVLGLIFYARSVRCLAQGLRDHGGLAQLPRKTGIKRSTTQHRVFFTGTSLLTHPLDVWLPRGTRVFVWMFSKKKIGFSLAPCGADASVAQRLEQSRRCRQGSSFLLCLDGCTAFGIHHGVVALWPFLLETSMIHSSNRGGSIVMFCFANMNGPIQSHQPFYSVITFGCPPSPSPPSARPAN